jgi:hypothetical protein
LRISDEIFYPHHQHKHNHHHLWSFYSHVLLLYLFR